MLKMKICPNCNSDFDETMNFCLNCGGVLKNKDKIINCTFEYKCPLDWNSLEKSTNDHIRFCNICEKDVHFADNQSEFNDLAGKGLCVAVKTNETKREALTVSNNKVCQVCNALITPNTHFCLGCGNVINHPPDFSRVTMGIPASPPEHFQKEEKTTNEEKKPWWKIWK